MDAPSGLRFSGDGYVHWSGRRGPGWFGDLARLVIAIPDGFAGSLPEARGNPDYDHELADEKRGDARLRRQNVRPDVQAERKQNPGDDADAQVEPEKRKEIAAE